MVVVEMQRLQISKVTSNACQRTFFVRILPQRLSETSVSNHTKPWVALRKDFLFVLSQHIVEFNYREEVVYITKPARYNYRYRRADNGEITTKKYAENHPKTTVIENAGKKKTK